MPSKPYEYTLSPAPPSPALPCPPLPSTPGWCQGAQLVWTTEFRPLAASSAISRSALFGGEVARLCSLGLRA